MNEYYVLDSPFIPGTLIRAEEVNAQFSDVEVGFERVEVDALRAIKLPDGFNGELNANAVARAFRVVGFNAAGDLELQSAFAYRGDFLTATAYQRNQVYRDPVSKNLYIVNLDHTSSSIAADLAANRVALAINVQDVETFKNEAAAAAASAAASASQAAASAAQSLDSAGQSALSASQAGDFAALASLESSIAVAAKDAAVLAKNEAEYFADLAQSANPLGAIQVNSRFITEDQTLLSGYNAISAGPIEIADGATVTIEENSTWSIA